MGRQFLRQRIAAGVVQEHFSVNGECANDYDFEDQLTTIIDRDSPFYEIT